MPITKKYALRIGTGWLQVNKSDNLLYQCFLLAILTITTAKEKYQLPTLLNKLDIVKKKTGVEKRHLIEQCEIVEVEEHTELVVRKIHSPDVSKLVKPIETQQKEPKTMDSQQYAIFGFNPQMWYKDIGNNLVEICELDEATIYSLKEGQDVAELAKELISKYVDQIPVLRNAMLVPVHDTVRRCVDVLDTRAKRDWDRIPVILHTKGESAWKPNQ